MTFALRLFAVFFACALLAGCASTRSSVAEPGRSLAGVERFYVQRNLKDNHRIHESLVRALRARGLQAESGPATLQPGDAQAVLIYEDRWAWDFGDHMVYLKIGARDPDAVFPYVSATFVEHVALKTDVDAVVSALVGELLAAGR